MESLSSLLSALASALDSATSVVPTEDSILPPQEGISLLNVKNELFLSYLQHLTFLLLLKLRQNPVLSSYSDSAKGLNEQDESIIIDQQDIVKKLVELRVYLEKGVRPLEGRLKYQIDKVVRAAEDADRTHQQNGKSQKGLAVNGSADSNDDESDEEESDGESQDASDQGLVSSAEINELSYRPNPAAFRRSAATETTKTDTSTKDGIYRPPRIAPTALPESRGRKERDSRRPNKSATIDEFIAHELSAAPVAEPSIGSTIVSGGRHVKSRKEREEEAERREYEETNLVRLPKQSKKEQAKLGSRRQDNFGGEDWRDLGVGLDRIERLTQKKSGSRGALERSRKRPIEDGPRGTGTEFGRIFEKKRRTHSRNRRG